MSFEVKLYVQGVGNVVPHTEGGSLLFLFPDPEPLEEGPWSRHIESPLRPGVPICDHRLAVQVRTKFLHEGLSDRWVTFSADKHWIKFDLDGAQDMQLPPEQIDGLINLSTVLAAAGLADNAAVDDAVLPGGPDAARRLRGGLYLEHGKPRGYQVSERALVNLEGEVVQENFDGTNTVEVSLGNGITRCNLELLRFGEEEPETFRLKTDDYGSIEIWIRHSCQLPMDPEPDPPYEISGDEYKRQLQLTDEDFVLNYLLLEDFEALTGALGEAGTLPVPIADVDFEGAGNMDRPHHNCQPALSTAKPYDAP